MALNCPALRGRGPSEGSISFCAQIAVNVLPALPTLGETRIMFQPQIAAQGRGHFVQTVAIQERPASELHPSSLESICLVSSEFSDSGSPSLSLCFGG